ncbi:MAG: hypothetical protein Q9193_000249 [Seirophora villosa]
MTRNPKTSGRRGEPIESPSKPKLADSGAPLGAYDTDSVRDRVRQWQAQGGGVVTTPNVYMEDSQEEVTDIKAPEKGMQTERRVHTRSTIKETGPEAKSFDTPLSRRDRQCGRSSEEKNEHGRSKIAPARRVVSDAHWRKDRSPPKNEMSPKTPQGTTPNIARYTDNDGIRVVPISTEKKSGTKEKLESNIKKQGVSNSDKVISISKPQHKRPSKSPAASTSSKSGTEDGISASPESCTRSKKGSGKKKTRAMMNPSTVRQGFPSYPSRPQWEESNPRSDRLSEPYTSSISASVSERTSNRKSQKGNILSQVLEESRKAFARPQVTSIETPRAPSVEAWLRSTPDPFVESEGPLVEAAVPHLDRNRTPSRIESLDDPNKIWDTLNSKDQPRSGVRASRRRKRIPSSTIFTDNPFPAGFDSGSPLNVSPAGSTSASKLVDLFDDASESPPSLTRRRARKSVLSPKRTANSTAEQNDQHEANKASAVCSNSTVPSIEAPNPATPLRSPGLKRRPFPSTGKQRLSTIASVDTLHSKMQTLETDTASNTVGVNMQSGLDDVESRELESGDQFRPDYLKPRPNRLTKHADLMSVLSMEQSGNKSICSARSIRTNRSRLATATIGDLMAELTCDEKKYMRELRTLVDGVIPVLLTCVLSKSDSAMAAGLFQPNCNGQEDPNFTKPIIDMGIALERLKSLHRRIPMQDGKSLVTWAQGAQRVYNDYLKAWRMGFQDVVVNLAPANESQSLGGDGAVSKVGGFEEGLPVNKDGDVVDVDGERVDVAFLLKRPLVRLKYLAKTLKGISVISPSAEVVSLAIQYHNLVTMARNRSNEERARLEDEAAANIDTTRARDPRTLAPLVATSIDGERRVRARDHFNLAFQHSSGQRIDCRVELLLRDEASETTGGGDLLICEVDGTGRWLLFPPLQFGRVSARTGELQGEIIVMIRGLSATGAEWLELFSLTSEDEQVGFEWVQMLGLTPIPPTVARSQSFLTKHQRKQSGPSHASTLEAVTVTPPAKSRTPSPREIDVPLGEPATHTSETWDHSKTCKPETLTPVVEQPLTPNKHRRKSQDMTSNSVPRSPHTYVDSVKDLRSLPSQAPEKILRDQGPVRRPRSFKEALGLTGTSNTSLGLKRTRAQKLAGSYGSQGSSQSPRASRCGTSSPKSSHAIFKDVQNGLEDSRLEVANDSGGSDAAGRSRGSSAEDRGDKKKDSRPSHHRSPSSVPSLDLPIVPKLRKGSPPATPVDEPEEESQWSSPPESTLPPAPSRKADRHSESPTRKIDVAAPSTAGHHCAGPVDLKVTRTPILIASTTHGTRRRSSSPLKHEYEPSTASDSSESDASTVEHNEASSVSSSDDEELEAGDIPGPLQPLGALNEMPRATPLGSIYSLPNGTLRPSESASQAPYKKVPPQPAKASKTIASIFSWSDKGSWESLHPDECSIIITPGLIEAFEMSAAHSADAPISAQAPIEDAETFSETASAVTGERDLTRNGRPLIALELTPLVLLRRGTAIDISIRSPPTANSQITSGNNIMFRSRNPEECEALYTLINHARIHNPTYIALQNARGPFDMTVGLGCRESTRAGSSRVSSWFGGIGRSSSYRASSAPTPSIAPSESSIGSMSSAFSALKRFGIGKGGGTFNIARSSISSRDGSRANSIYTSSDNSSGSGTSTPLPPNPQGDSHGEIGLSNTRIRLYFRETQTRWRDMGSARLTIMRPSPPDISLGTLACGESVARPTTARYGANEKRIVVCGKTKGEVLLDATLGETCFERVGRQGIAVSVWEDIVGPNGEVGTVGAVGGVGAGRAKVYMIQVGYFLCCGVLLELFQVADTGGVRR